MTYAYNGSQIFRSQNPDYPDCTPPKLKRSDHRMKRFESTYDERAWNILEKVRFRALKDLVTGSQICLVEDECHKYVPLNDLINILTADKDARIAELEDKLRGGDGKRRKRAASIIMPENFNMDSIQDPETQQLLRKAMNKLENIDEIVNENKKLHCKLRVSEEKIKNLEEKKKRLESELAELRTQSQILRDLDKAHYMLDNVGNVAADPMAGEADEIELTNLNEERNRLQEKVKLLEKELEESRKKENEIEILKKQSQSDTYSLEEITKENECYKKKLNSMKCLETQIQDLKKYGIALAKKYKKESQKTAEQMKRMCSAVKELDKLREERDYLLRKVDELDRHESQYKVLQRKLQRVDSIIAENEILNNKLQALDQLEKENNYLRCKLDELETIEMNAADDKKRIMQLQEAVADQEEEMKDLLCQIEKLTNGRAEEELERLKCELYETSSKLKLCEEQLAEIPLLEAEIDDLRKKLQLCCQAFAEQKTGENLYQQIEVRLPCQSTSIAADYKSHSPKSSVLGVRKEENVAQSGRPINCQEILLQQEKLFESIAKSGGSEMKEIMSCEEVQELLQSSKGIITCVLEDMIEHQKEMEELERYNVAIKNEIESLKAKMGPNNFHELLNEINVMKKIIEEKDAEISKLKEQNRQKAELLRNAGIEYKADLESSDSAASVSDLKTLQDLNNQLKFELQAANDGLKKIGNLEKMLEMEHIARCKAEKKLKDYTGGKQLGENEDCCKALQREVNDFKLQIVELNKLIDELKKENELLRDLQQPCPDFSKELEEKCALENLLTLLQAEIDTFKGQKLSDECEALRNELKRVLEQNCQLKALINCYRQRLDLEKRSKQLAEEEGKRPKRSLGMEEEIIPQEEFEKPISEDVTRRFFEPREITPQEEFEKGAPRSEGRKKRSVTPAESIVEPSGPIVITDIAEDEETEKKKKIKEKGEKPEPEEKEVEEKEPFGKEIFEEQEETLPKDFLERPEEKEEEKKLPKDFLEKPEEKEEEKRLPKDFLEKPEEKEEEKRLPKDFLEKPEDKEEEKRLPKDFLEKPEEKEEEKRLPKDFLEKPEEKEDEKRLPKDFLEKPEDKEEEKILPKDFLEKPKDKEEEKILPKDFLEKPEDKEEEKRLPKDFLEKPEEKEQEKILPKEFSEKPEEPKEKEEKKEIKDEKDKKPIEDKEAKKPIVKEEEDQKRKQSEKPTDPSQETKQKKPDETKPTELKDESKDQKIKEKVPEEKKEEKKEPQETLMKDKTKEKSEEPAKETKPEEKLAKKKESEIKGKEVSPKDKIEEPSQEKDKSEEKSPLEEEEPKDKIKDSKEKKPEKKGSKDAKEPKEKSKEEKLPKEKSLKKESEGMEEDVSSKDKAKESGKGKVKDKSKKSEELEKDSQIEIQKSLEETAESDLEKAEKGKKLDEKLAKEEKAQKEKLAKEDKKAAKGTQKETEKEKAEEETKEKEEAVSKKQEGQTDQTKTESEAKGDEKLQAKDKKDEKQVKAEKEKDSKKKEALQAEDGTSKDVEETKKQRTVTLEKETDKKPEKATAAGIKFDEKSKTDISKEEADKDEADLAKSGKQLSKIKAQVSKMKMEEKFQPKISPSGRWTGGNRQGMPASGVDKDAEIGRLQDIITEKDLLIKDLNQALNELKKERTSLKNSLAKYAEESDQLPGSKEKKPLRRDTSEFLAGLENEKDPEKLKEIIKQLQRENADKIRKLKDQHEKELNARDKNYNDNLNAMKGGYETDIRKLAERHKLSIMRLQSLHEDEVQELNTNYETQMETMQTQSEMAMNEIAKGSAAKVNQLMQKHNKELKESESKFKQDLKDKEDQYMEALSGLRRSLTKSMEEVAMWQRRAEDYGSKLLGQRSRDSLKFRKSSMKKLNMMRNKYEDKLKEEREKYEAQIESLKKALKAKEEEGICECAFAKEKPQTESKSALNFNEVLQKILGRGIEALSFNELALVHRKVCRALQDKVLNSEISPSLEPPIGDSYPQAPLMREDKEYLLQRIYILEKEINEKQRETQDTIINMEMAVKKERYKLQELRNLLQSEQMKNSELTLLLSSQTRLQTDLREERNRLENQASLHKSLALEKTKELNEEKEDKKLLEIELQRLRSTVQQLCKALEIERQKSEFVQRKGSDLVQTMQAQLKQSANQGNRLATQLENEVKCRQELQSQIKAIQQSYLQMVNLQAVDKNNFQLQSPVETKIEKEKQNLNQIREKKNKTKPSSGKKLKK